MDINDLYDDEVESSSNEPVIDSLQTNQDSDDDFMLDFLRSKGIDDPSKIKFEDENNQIVERDWNDLTREEQINILNTPLTVVDNSNDNNLSDDEIELINTIRGSNMSVNDYLQSLQGEQVVQEPTYSVDELSDDELYLLDLESRVGELSEDDAVQALGIAKQNEDFYKKQVDGIRKEYKEREDYKHQQEQLELEQQQQEALDEYQRAISDAIDDFTSVGNLDLNFDDNDKEELAKFMLSQDETGANYLYKALQDPKTLVKAAWFVLNGDEAFNSVADYFKDLIKLISLNLYNKGLEDGKKGVISRPSVVINKQKTKSSSQPLSADDLFDED